MKNACWLLHFWAFSAKLPIVESEAIYFPFMAHRKAHGAQKGGKKEKEEEGRKERRGGRRKEGREALWRRERYKEDVRKQEASWGAREEEEEQ